MKPILNVETNEPIPYSFKKITYRKYNKAIGLLQDSKNEERTKQNQMIDEACEILIEGSTALLDGASNGDVQDAITAAIEFNQTSEADAKK